MNERTFSGEEIAKMDKDGEAVMTVREGRLSEERSEVMKLEEEIKGLVFNEDETKDLETLEGIVNGRKIFLKKEHSNVEGSVDGMELDISDVLKLFQRYHPYFAAERKAKHMNNVRLEEARKDLRLFD